jgi:hypothetical protein
VHESFTIVFKEKEWGVGVNSFGSRHNLVAGSCEHSNYPPGFIKDRELHDSSTTV